MDDRRLGLVIRALRRRLAWRQVDLARRAGVSQPVVSRIERGHLATISTATLRRVLAALDVRLEFDPRWRGGEIDRVTDQRHAALARAAAATLSEAGWTTHQEVTYAIYSERGSIDLLAVKEQDRLAVITEIKSEIVTWEATLRRFDAKVRLLPQIMLDRFGWQPREIGRVLVLEDSMTNRRRIAALGEAAAQQFPSRTLDVKRWLRSPSGPLRGIWFLSSIPRGTGRERRGGTHRVRRPPSRR
jgi:Predicted transcriptional regulator with C-terminal CBS domains